MWKFCDKIRSKRILCSEKVQSLILFKVLVGIVNFNIFIFLNIILHPRVLLLEEQDYKHKYTKQELLSS